MNSSEIRKRFINYFTDTLKARDKVHVEIHSSPLVPERHPTLLFTNSGMVQFTPYFLGEKNPESDFGSKRLCSVQKCIRTGDLDIVGKSKYHLVFFEMLGSWSIGDYGKTKAVEVAFDLLTNPDYGYGLKAEKLIPTIFAGNDEAPADIETLEAWKKMGIPEARISRLPASENWWAPAGLSGPGPCGPCTEVLYDRGPSFGEEEEVPGLTDNPRYLEIWNAGVFMQYNRDAEGQLHDLPFLSVDTGAGLERFALLLQGADSVFETDLFLPIINKIISLGGSDLDYEKDEIKFALRQSAEHIKSSTFLMSEKVYPSNKDQGYVVRRLLRTAFNNFEWTLKIAPEKMAEVVPVIFDMYLETYPELGKPEDVIEMMKAELNLYKQISDGAKKFIQQNYVKAKMTRIGNPFDIYQSTGASQDLIKSIAAENNLEVDFTNFEEHVKAHQELSRAGAGEKFKGGLGDHSEETTRLHTATHLLHRALREVLGSGVQQMGSNITPERLRFDFSFDDKMTAEQVQAVEDIVNEKISEKLPVQNVTLPKVEAEQSGALHFFKEKYPDMVKIYYVGDSIDTAWSKEFCGGPHVENTGELGHFKIQKEEAVGKGVRRIKAVLE
jgi:alanyl-tRNA synthetase